MERCLVCRCSCEATLPELITVDKELDAGIISEQQGRISNGSLVRAQNRNAGYKVSEKLPSRSAELATATHMFGMNVSQCSASISPSVTILNSSGRNWNLLNIRFVK